MKLSVRAFGFFILLISAALGYFYSYQNGVTQVYNAASLQASHPTLANYCLAIRGNGELEPAHWGGLAKTIEQLGLPSAMAGGSSATISMFWLNAVAQNLMLQDDSLSVEEKNMRAALLMKSFLGFFLELKNTKFSQDFFKLYGVFNQLKAQEMTLQMKTALLKKNEAEIALVLKQGIQLGLFDEKSLQPVFASLNNKTSEKTRFYLDELLQSVQQFGKFNANTDANLFFRAGLISFENAAESFGRLAAFYAASSISADVAKNWNDFFQDCTSASKGLSWVGLMQKNPICGVRFHALFESYFQNEPQLHFENHGIGKPIAVYPTTSVLVGSAVQEFNQAMNDYHSQLDHQFGLRFKLSHPEDVRFGYWGDPAKLDLISKSLDRTDEKNRRFLALGTTTWKQVLSLSPAEPGLSPFKKFSAGSENMISAGGWSDLHPVSVLKASGCENVIYLTRQGAESVFAQGMANRLMNLGRDAQLNAVDGTMADEKDIWTNLFSMTSPQSSINRALANADAVLCTDWNHYDVKKNLPALIENAYQSGYFISPNAMAPIKNLNPILSEKAIGCQAAK